MSSEYTPERVLTTMSGSYLNRWKLTSEEESVWIEGLSGFSPSVLRRAANEVRIDFPDWPPTLMEFRRFCVSQMPKGQSGSEKDLMDKYKRWAQAENMEGPQPGECAEAYRCRLAFQHARRKYYSQLSGAELAQRIAENRAANQQNRHKP